MNRTIYKYQLSHRPEWTNLHDTTPEGFMRLAVRMKAGAEILFVGASMEDDRLTPTIWAKVDIDAGDCFRRFVLVPTGRAMPPNLKYLGTALTSPFVWHVHEEV